MLVVAEINKWTYKPRRWPLTCRLLEVTCLVGLDVAMVYFWCCATYLKPNCWIYLQPPRKRGRAKNKQVLKIPRCQRADLMLSARGFLRAVHRFLLKTLGGSLAMWNILITAKCSISRFCRNYERNPSVSVANKGYQIKTGVKKKLIFFSVYFLSLCSYKPACCF